MESNYTAKKKGLVLTNAKVLTLEEANPFAEVVVTDGNTILYVGNQKGITPELLKDREVIDLKGCTVAPGFIDSHIHLLELARGRSGVDLWGCKSIKELLELLKKESSTLQEGQWLIGYRWDDSQWHEGRYPTLLELDSACPKNPVFLKRICLHQALVNSLALERAKLTEGESELLNKVTGFSALVGGKVKSKIETCLEFREEELLGAMEAVQKELLALGITSIHQISTNFSLIKKFAEGGKLLLRVYFCPVWEKGLTTKPVQELPPLIKPGAVKFFIDGSIGAHSAALQEPYLDEPKCHGELYWEKQALKDTLGLFHRAGRQLSIHAIGDCAIVFLLEAMEEVLEMYPAEKHRHRIEHCELVSKGAMERIKKLRLVVSAQPNFISVWGLPDGLYKKRLGLRRWMRMNPMAEFISASIPLVFGSDGIPPGPIYGIHAAVNHPVESSRISPIEAIKCYTIAGAFASFEEDFKGSLLPGKLADITVLSQDPTSCLTENIKDTTVIMTILDGKIVYNL